MRQGQEGREPMRRSICSATLLGLPTGCACSASQSVSAEMTWRVGFIAGWMIGLRVGRHGLVGGAWRLCSG